MLAIYISESGQICGKAGDDPNTAYEKAAGQYGRVADAVKIIDPRTDEEVK